MVDFLVKEKDKLKYFNTGEDQILNNNKIKVNLVESRIDIYNDIARIMANKLRENNLNGDITSFILPVGPRGQYRRFARICNMEKISCKNLITINMDEYIDDNDNIISEGHPLSFRGFMRKNFFDLLEDNLKMKPENIYFPDPENISQIEKVIKKIDGVDICFGGVGINGHIAFNEPMNDGEITGAKFRELKTRILDLSRETIIVSSIKNGGYTEFVPKRCITIGMAEIFTAKKLRFYLEHNRQSAALRRIIFEEPNPSFPATFLKEHRDCTITVSKKVLLNYMDNSKSSLY